ncbi:MAG: kynureninase [Anaerolineales bacterium]|nr:kynureninase [Anaerolineales bacterium]
MNGTALAVPFFDNFVGKSKMKEDFQPTPAYAFQLDSQDKLASFREAFVIDDPNLIYLDGNSLGRLPKAAIERAKQIVEEEWGRDLIRGWNKGWWEAPARVGDKIGHLIGAAPGQVLVNDTVSLNLYKLTMAALAYRPEKKRIVTDTMNFPSDLYILQGIVHSLSFSGGAFRDHEVIRIDSTDSGLTPDLAALESAINEDTALVTLSHVLFKSGYLYDMQRITELAHRKGALVLWDLSHSVGSLPVALDKCNADFAIGCTYKYLNGGPGAPAFLYINKAIQEKVTSPIWGWWGQNNPFAFGLDYEPAPGANRFLAGTQPMISLLTMEAALDPLLSAGMDSIRAKSILMTNYASTLTENLLAPFGFSLGSPVDSARRGSHISICHTDGYRINRALIEEMNVIPDFREPDNIRLGFAPLYLSFMEIWEGFDRIKRVMTEKRYEKYPKQKLTVT